MKRISLLILSLLFLSAAFQGDSPPPGWYIQQIPVNKDIVDIHFTDTLHGWAVTDWSPSYDTGYVLKTTNGGTNWVVNYAEHVSFNAIQFIDENTGYACGGKGIGLLYKTTNSGTNWNVLFSAYLNFKDLYFLNKDTGWVCDDDNLVGVGLLKTTNGGNNWVQQLNNSYQPQRLFFLNKDTGWVMTANNYLYRTTNSGMNWILLNTFGDQLYNLCFTTIDTGWVIQYGLILKTIDGGSNWITQADPNPSGSFPYDIKMINSNYGYISTAYSKILKTVNGNNWIMQNAPIGGYGPLFLKDSLRGWVYHANLGINDIVSTVDGGGPVLSVNNGVTESPKEFSLGQNYPNPFNASTRIKFSILKSCYLDLKIFNIKGQEVANLISGLGYKPGEYDFYFDAGKYSLSSGVYFYHMKGATTDNKEIFLDTKRMLMVK